MLGARAHQLDALSGQIAQGTFGRWVDVAGGQDAQPQHVCEVGGVGLVVAVLESVVAFHGDGIGKPDVVAFGHQAVDQPVPVVGGFDDHPGQFNAVRREQGEYLRKVVGTAPAEQHLVGLVRHHDNAIVRMQIYTAISHLGLL